MKVHAIVNPNSNKFRKGKIKISDLENLLKKYEYDIFVTENPRDSLKKSLDESLNKEPNILIVAGGDGTLHYVVSNLILMEAKMPYLALLPAGTVNAFARGFGIKEGLEGLKRNLEKLMVDSADTLSITIDDETLYGFISAGGAIAKFLEHYYNPSTGETSVRKATSLILKTLISAALEGNFAKEVIFKEDAHVILNNKHYGDKLLAFVVSSISPNVIGLKPFNASGNLASEEIYCIATKDMYLKEIISSLIRGALGLRIKARKLFFGKVNHFSAYYQEKSRITIDGELYDVEKYISINRGPSLNFIKF